MRTDERLAASREALLNAMGYVRMTSNITGEAMLGKTASHPPARGRGAWRALPRQWQDAAALRWLRGWWLQHPVHDIAAIGRPYLQDFAQRHPAQLVALSAGTGAALWLLKPWKRLSTAALLSLALKAGSKSMLKAAATRAWRSNR